MGVLATQGCVAFGIWMNHRTTKKAASTAKEAAATAKDTNYQVTQNGGASMKDAVTRTENKLDSLIDDFDDFKHASLEDRSALWAAVIANQRDRIRSRRWRR